MQYGVIVCMLYCTVLDCVAGDGDGSAIINVRVNTSSSSLTVLRIRRSSRFVPGVR